jgi:alanyl-tRNA synthetase
VALFGPSADTVSFVVATTTAAVDRGLRAGDLVKAFLPDIAGRGGGKPDLAQGGGTRPDGVPAAIETLRAAVAATAA